MTKRKTPTPKQDELTERRAQVAALYRQGLPQYEIAQTLQVSDATVSRDLYALRETWLQSTIFDFNAAKLHELSVIDRVENQAWQAWIASTQPLVTQETHGTKGGAVLAATKKLQDRSGNPTLLNTILNCVRERVRILGLEAAHKVDHSGVIRIRRAEDLTDDELAAIASGSSSGVIDTAQEPTDTA